MPDILKTLSDIIFEEYVIKELYGQLCQMYTHKQSRVNVLRLRQVVGGLVQADKLCFEIYYGGTLDSTVVIPCWM